jgi:hypothetical protein
MRGDKEGAGYVLEKGAVKIATLSQMAADIQANEGFVAIDLSDTTNFGHTETGCIRLLGFHLHIETTGDATGFIKIGVVLEVDASNGTVHYPWVYGLNTEDNSTDGSDQRDLWEKAWGVDLRVDTSVGSEKLYHVITSEQDTGTTTWQTDVTLDSPRGATTVAPAAGDLVVFVDRDAGNIRFCLTCYYETEA